MALQKTNTHLTVILILLFATIYSYGGNQENLLVKAIQYFDAKKYVEAENILQKLIEENPEHLMVSYYYGACRTENNHFGSQEIQYLLKGSTGEAPLKTDYYLGIQYHAQNKWNRAIEYYQRYKNKTDIDEQDEFALSQKIQQCANEINPYENEKIEEAVTSDVLPVALVREKEIEKYNPVIVNDSQLPLDTVVTNDTTEVDSVDIPETETIPTLIPKPVKSDPINFVIDGELIYIDTTNFKTETGLELYLNGQSKQKELESELKEVEILRNKYASAKSYEEKQIIGEKILAAENNNYQLQQETTALLMRAKQCEIEYWKTVSVEEKNTFIENMEELLTIEKENIDSSFIIVPNILLTETKSTTPAEEDVENELIYKIQLGAYSRGLPSYVQKMFDKLSYIRKIDNYTDKKGVVVYTTGHLTNLDDAIKMQNQVRLEGVEDAFVVPYFNEKRITLKEAKEIEAER